MILFFTIYILGIISSLYLMYHSMEKGDELSLSEFLLCITGSLFSWVAFLIVILARYGDDIVFKKI